MGQFFDWVLSAQRSLQGALSAYVLDLFASFGGFATGMAVATALGLVHALTPGHGKSVIFSYFLGQPASLFTGMRVALGAALTHGTIAVLLVLIAGRVISPLGRPTGPGAWLELIAGAIVAAIGALYVGLSLYALSRRRAAAFPAPSHDHGPAGSRPFLAVAMGLLPCPLTIIVVGSAINRGATAGGIALAAGISLGAAVTIGYFGLLGMALRRGGLALAGGRIHRLASALTWLELATSLLILALGLVAVAGGVSRFR